MSVAEKTISVAVMLLICRELWRGGVEWLDVRGSWGVSRGAGYRDTQKDTKSAM